jgi:hypothetical protein
MRITILSLLLFAVPALCSAEIYRWTDDNGQVGYADDLGKVPKKFRDKAVTSEKQEQAVEVIEKSEPEMGKMKGADNKGEASDEKMTGKTKSLFAGKSGETWKQDFARQKQEVKSLEEQLAGIKERMSEGDKLSRGEYLSLQNTVRDLEVRIAKTQKKLEALTESADRAELPAEFR